MKLEKLTISHEKGARPGRSSFKVLFNPSQISYSKSVSWETLPASDNPKTNTRWWSRFQSVQPETMTISLFFDTTEGEGSDWFIPSFLEDMPSGTNVLKLTERVSALAQLDRELHRPPICRLRWGKVSLFRGVLTSLNQQLLLFLPNGTPVRAQLDCTFQERATDSKFTRGELHSADVAKTYTVKPGDTLMRIAAELYEDASAWRVIAAANAIDNPRRLIPGQVLAIPPLR